MQGSSYYPKVTAILFCYYGIAFQLMHTVTLGLVVLPLWISFPPKNIILVHLKWDLFLFILKLFH